MIDNINFVAFDFETADKYFACQLGIIVVEKGKIVEEKCFLIQPPNNKYNNRNISIHGISSEHTKSSPSFKELWPLIMHYFEHRVIVYHGNNNDFDLLVLESELERNNIEMPKCLAMRNTFHCFDNETKSKRLDYLCKIFNIEMEMHHNALSDARCCAKLFLKILFNENANWNLEPELQPSKKRSNFIYKEDSNRIISSDTKVQDLTIVINENTIFYNQKVVISGVFTNYPKRNDLGLLLKNFGADINGAISSKTNLFIVGNDCGPKKMEKAFELIGSGHNIRIIEEKELYKILEEINHG